MGMIAGFPRGLHSALSNQQSAISNQQSAISNQQSAISNQQSAISNQQSVISNQQSAISNQTLNHDFLGLVGLAKRAECNYIICDLFFISNYIYFRGTL
jgi:hypothetical protein